MEKQLEGQVRTETDVEAWCRAMARWGVDSWSHYAPHYRGGEMLAADGQRGRNMTSVAFMQELLPGFEREIDAEEIALQERSVRRMADACQASGLVFHYGFPFPIFPVQSVDVIARVAPQFVAADGQIDLYSSHLPELLKAACRLYVRQLPDVRRLDIWICEGCGEVIKVSFEELADNLTWLPPILAAFDEVCNELGIEGLVFAHDYFHTNATRRNVHRTLARHPRLVVLEDLTWPEENGRMPFMGFLPEAERRALFAANPVMVNCLTDTEYLGQGWLPCVLPRWWKTAASESIRHGAAAIRGRCGHWDNGRTDVNFNRLNAHLLMHFAAQPDADPKAALADAAREAFGPVPEGLVEILYATEPVLKDVMAINGVVPVHHSQFPPPRFLDRRYSDSPLAMKAVDDLFQPPGTPCHVPIADELSADKHWRCQRQVVAREVSEYLATKDRAITWLEVTVPQVGALAGELSAEHVALFVNGYMSLLVLARGMRLFVEVAAAHRRWMHEKSLNDAAFAREVSRLAGELRRVADSVDFPMVHDYDDALRTLAAFIEGLV